MYEYLWYRIVGSLCQLCVDAFAASP